MAEALSAAKGVHVRAAELIAMPIRTFSSKLKQYQLSGRKEVPGTPGKLTLSQVSAESPVHPRRYR